MAALELSGQAFEASSLRVAAGPHVAEVARLALKQAKGQVQVDGGAPLSQGVEAASAELSGVKVHGPLPSPPTGASFDLGPLAGAEGDLHAKIVDAHLMFDAEVTVPIRGGGIRFNDAEVEHVGPDSRMGVSKLGLYVDAPDGRSYLYQFPSTPVAGVTFEERGALLGPWVSDRGSLQLQPFLQALLVNIAAGAGTGFTEQARQLLGRTSLSGQLQLGDGDFATMGLKVALAGRNEGRNAVRLDSPAVGQGVTAGIASLLAKALSLQAGAIRIEAAEIRGAVTLRLAIEGGQARYELQAPSLTVAGVRLR